MKAIIVDDEPRAIELIRSYLIHFPQVELAATFRNGLKAAEFCTQENVDLVFLDINMPYLSGMALSRILGKDIRVVFTTAYSEYAVESYEVEARDYLLKPISLERFTQTMLKILAPRNETLLPEKKPLFIKSGTRVYRVKTDDILYLEKDGNYMTYYLENQKILARESISEALQALPEAFFQIHKSYIINRDKIVFVDKDTVCVAGITLPVGNTYREFVKKIYL
ncbi:MAG: LytTR family DNA-binding domain-containing protein [Bacteroidia bacterium]|nr:LytTR family DNA-binding domain-containing protein [Bacteroidia bacterium]